MAVNNPCLKDVFCHEDISRVLIPFLSEKDHENIRIVSREFQGSIDGFAKEKVLALHDMIPARYKTEFRDNVLAKIVDRAKKMDPMFVNPICSNLPPISSYLRWKIMLCTCVHELTANELEVQRAPTGGPVSVYGMGTPHFVFRIGLDFNIWSLQQGRSLGLFNLEPEALFQCASILNDGRLLVLGTHIHDMDMVRQHRRFFRIYHQRQLDSVMAWELDVEHTTNFYALDTVHTKWIDKGGQHHDEVVYVGTGRFQDRSDGLRIGAVHISDGLLSEPRQIDLSVLDDSQAHHRARVHGYYNHLKVELCNKTWLAINSNKYGLVLYNLATGMYQVSRPRNKNNCILSCKGKANSNIVYTMETASPGHPVEVVSLHCFKMNEDGTLDHQFSIPDIISTSWDFCLGTRHDTIVVSGVQYDHRIQYSRFFDGKTGTLLRKTPIRSMSMLCDTDLHVTKMPDEFPKLFLVPKAN